MWKIPLQPLSHRHLQNVSIGDRIQVKVVNVPCLRWEKEHIRKIIEWNDGLVWGVYLDSFVSTTNKKQCINRLSQHIKPLKLKDTLKSNKNIEILDSDNSESAIRSDENGPRRVATKCYFTSFNQTVMLTYVSTWWRLLKYYAVEYINCGALIGSQDEREILCK